MEKLKLFGTRILIKDFATEGSDLEKTKGGIYIPQTNSPSKNLKKAEVIGIGDECTKIKPGQIIIYHKTGPAPFKVGEETYEMIDESAIIGVYE